MTAAAPIRRLTCARCLRAQSACICRWVTPTAHEVEVLILQHPLEVTHAKGSARLLHLSLPRSQLIIGEVFPPEMLQSFLSAPLHPEASAGSPPLVMLLYPAAPHAAAPAQPPAAALSRCPTPLRLIVLDGTWRKSRKMLYCNPLLQQLPRLGLRAVPSSGYLIRKAHRPDQLSTLEATCAALTLLEGSAARYEPLLRAFGHFVQQGLQDKAGASARATTPWSTACAPGTGSPQHRQSDC